MARLRPQAFAKKFRVVTGHFLHVVESLVLYGAAGLVSFGWFLLTEIGVAPAASPVLWFFGGLFVYNLDRLIPDPADSANQLNVTALPIRERRL